MTTDGRTWRPVFLGDDVPRPKGPYSPGVRAGDLVFVSGQIPADPKTGTIVADDLPGQARQVLANVRGVLEASGASLRDVVSVIVYLADVDDWAAFNEIYKGVFSEPYPTRTALGVSLRGIRVEVSAIAYAPPKRG